MQMAAASSRTDVSDGEHSECKGVVLVAPWTTRCEIFISACTGLLELLSLASEHEELHIEESSTSRRSYVVKVFVYATLPPPEVSELFKKNAPGHLDGSTDYGMYFLLDKAHIFKGMLDFRTMHLSDLPAEKAPLLEEIRILIAFVSSHIVGRQSRRCSVAALQRVGNMLPSLVVSYKRKRWVEILAKISPRKQAVLSKVEDGIPA
jgi:hypothetical protein